MYRAQNLARILLIYREISVSQHQETTLTVQNNRSRQGKLVCITLYMLHVVSYRITAGGNGAQSVLYTEKVCIHDIFFGN